MAAPLASTTQPDGQLRSAKVEVLLRPPDVAELDRRAREAGRTRSEEIRQLLVQGLAAEGVRAATRVPRRRDPSERLERNVAVKLTAADVALVQRHRGSRSIAAVIRQCVRRELEKRSPGRLPTKPRSRERFVSRVTVPLADADVALIRERLRGRGSVAGFIRRAIRRQLEGGE